MRIAFVIGSLTGGGAERVVALLANSFADKGYEVCIISIASKTRTYDLSKKVKLYYCINKYSIPGVSFLRRVKDLKTVLREYNPDICISFTVGVNIYAILASVREKWRLIVCERNDPQFDPQSKIIRIMRSLTYKSADGFVFQTTGERDYFSNRIRERSWIIPNPINGAMCEAYEGTREKRFVTAVRLEPQKNLKLAISAFYEFVKEYNGFIFQIYGEGTQREELQSFIDENSLTDKVFLCGRSNTLYEDIKSAYAFVLSSDYEGMSNSMLEAMALGLPVISTDYPSGGARMVIYDHSNGILVPVGCQAELVAAMKEIVDNPELAEKLSKEASKIRMDLSITRIVSMWEECINSIKGARK